VKKQLGNGEVIPFKTGKSFKYTATLPYSAGMEFFKIRIAFKRIKR